MRVLVDTSVLIRYARRDARARSRLNQLVASQQELGICAVIMAEFYSGNSYGERPEMDRIIDQFQFWPTTRFTGMIAAAYRRQARRNGITMPVADTLIAAVAREREATLLTANPRHFPMPDLRVEALP